jgi:RNA polymerase sigma-70 factor (ECF subfamily)
MFALMEETNVLIEKAKTGDKEAFGKLYKEFFVRIYRYCKTNLYKEAVAEDVCQEVFIRAWKALPTFTLKDGGTFQAFLFRIARNLIIDLSRKKKEYSLETYQEIAVEEELEEKLDRKDNLEKVKLALSKLSDTDRQLIILRYFEELSHAEVAKILNIKEGNLRVKTIRLLKKLKDLIKK